LETCSLKYAEGYFARSKKVLLFVHQVSITIGQGDAKWNEDVYVLQKY
jgi:hypothetical protein